MRTGQSRSQNQPTPPRRMEVPPTSLASASVNPSPPSSPEFLHAVSTIAGPEVTARTTSMKRHSEGEGHPPNDSHEGENRRSRGGRRVQHRNHRHQPSAQEAQATVVPHPSRERALEARNGRAGPAGSLSVPQRSTTATRPSAGRASHKQMAQEIVNYLKLPTAARAA